MVSVAQSVCKLTFGQSDRFQILKYARAPKLCTDILSSRAGRSDKGALSPIRPARPKLYEKPEITAFILTMITGKW
jgi:hypothetical protein